MRRNKACTPLLLLLSCCIPSGCSPFPHIEALVPPIGNVGDVIDIRDSGGASLSPEGIVFFGQVPAQQALLWTPQDVYLQVPSGVSGAVPVMVSIGGYPSNLVNFTVVDGVDLRRIMCFGDSIFHWGVPATLQDLIHQDEDLNALHLTVLDQSKNGEKLTEPATWTRWQIALDYSEPEWVILLEGTNDISDTTNVPMQTIQQRIIDMVDEANNTGAQPVLCTLLPRIDSCGDTESPTTEEFNDWLRSYASGAGIPVVDVYDDFVSTPDWQNVYFATDCVHPTTVGRQRIASLLTEQLRALYLPPCSDLDGDGYGDPASPVCPYPAADCDDSDPDVNPGVGEAPFGDPICVDGVDNDCDGDIDALDPGCLE